MCAETYGFMSAVRDSPFSFLAYNVERTWVGSMDLQASEVSRVCSLREISRVCAENRKISRVCRAFFFAPRASRAVPADDHNRHHTSRASSSSSLSLSPASPSPAATAAPARRACSSNCSSSAAAAAAASSSSVAAYTCGQQFSSGGASHAYFPLCIEEGWNLDFAHLTRLKHFAASTQFRAFAPKSGKISLTPHPGRGVSAERQQGLRSARVHTGLL